MVVILNRKCFLVVKIQKIQFTHKYDSLSHSLSGKYLHMYEI